VACGKRRPSLTLPALVAWLRQLQNRQPERRLRYAIPDGKSDGESRAMSVLTAISRHGVTLPMERIAEFCRRWRIRELEIFGSFLREDFRPDSDMDFLYTFAEDVHWTLYDLVTMDQELAAIVGREVDLVSRSAVERSQNFIRRDDILSTSELIYAE
jgi:predicted nucleotidyltransferase